MGLFGGSKETTTTGYKPAMNIIKRDFIPAADEFGKKYQDGSGLYQGTTLGAEDPLLAQGQNEALDVAGQYRDQYGQVTDSLEGFLNYDPNSATNQMARDAFGNQVQAQFDQSIRPGVENRSTFSGQYGGPQSNVALGVATQGLNREIASQEANLAEADRNRAFEAMGIAPQLLAGQFLPSEITQRVGEQRTGRNQLEQLDEISQFEQPYRNEAQALNDQQTRLTNLAGLASTTTEKTDTSLGQAALGLGMAYLGGGGGLGALSGLLGAGAGAPGNKGTAEGLASAGVPNLPYLGVG